MERLWFTAALWLALALLAALIGTWARVSVALTEIVAGIAAQLLLDTAGWSHALGTQEVWVTFLAGAGAVILTFLAGAELEPEAFRRRWRESTALGLVGFGAPFLGAAWAVRFLLGWDPRASWLAGVALSTTSVAVVYAVLLELNLNRTEFGKVLLSACFINDLGTVIALGLLFAPFTARSALFIGALVAGLVVLVRTTAPFFRRYGGRTAEFEAKALLLALFLLGGLAAWSGSEAVLPAYLIGMALAGVVGRDHGLLRRLRTLTFGFLTPFYFIRAGSFVQVPTVLAALGPFFVLFGAKAISKFVGIFPLTRRYRYAPDEAMYTTLLMSTGLTFGTISALYGLTHGIITQAQYSLLVATIIASAVIPTWVANRFFLPRHHVERAAAALEAVPAVGGE
jgi:glutathione-regulated potassium-efflux system ancillary protein KefC